MKKALLAICFALVVSAGTAAASTDVAKKKATWTESKAERFVRSEATVALTTEDRFALEAALRPAIELYRLLAAEAGLTGRIGESDAYNEAAHLYERVLSDVQFALSIDSADCTGSGVAAEGRRFRTFRCTVTSGSLQLPASEHAEDGDPADDAQSRTIGPIEAELNVRVTGTSSFSYKAL